MCVRRGAGGELRAPMDAGLRRVRARARLCPVWRRPRPQSGAAGQAVASSSSRAKRRSPHHEGLHVKTRASLDPSALSRLRTSKAIEVGSRVVYRQAAGPTALDSDVVLDLPGPGNNKAFGHCRLDFVTLSGCAHSRAGPGSSRTSKRVPRSRHLGASNWAWDGPYSLSPQD